MYVLYLCILVTFLSVLSTLPYPFLAILKFNLVLLIILLSFEWDKSILHTPPAFISTFFDQFYGFRILLKNPVFVFWIFCLHTKFIWGVSFLNFKFRADVISTFFNSFYGFCILLGTGWLLKESVFVFWIFNFYTKFIWKV